MTGGGCGRAWTRRAFAGAWAAACLCACRGHLPRRRFLDDAAVRRMARWAG
jgi:hypothetical protein